MVLQHQVTDVVLSVPACRLSKAGYSAGVELAGLKVVSLIKSLNS